MVQGIRDSAQIISAIVNTSTDLRRPIHSIWNMRALNDYIKIHCIVTVTSKCGHGCVTHFKVERYISL